MDDSSPAPVHRSLVVHLRTDLRMGMAALPVLEPDWDAEWLWPLPDELPDAPLLFALQDAMVATAEARDAALDELDAQLADAPVAASGWEALAQIEAERILESGSYTDALDEHNAELWRWADAGGRGPMPEPPLLWSSSSLGGDAQALALEADSVASDPALGELARLTAASLWLDWTADPQHEAAATALVLDVVVQSDDPNMLVGAVELLVGSRSDISAEALDELSTLLPELPDRTARRLAWFLSDRWLEQGAADRALQAMDAGLFEARAADLTQPTPILDGLRHARATLTARLGGPVEAGGDAVIDAMAWWCWLDLQTNDDRWVVDGTDYAGTLLVSEDGAQWTGWTDQNPHQECMVEQAHQRVWVADPGSIQVTFTLPGDA